MVKLRLKNFKCYEDKKFEFSDKGMILLSASSGSGKTSILQAIFFALFGEGSKIISHGKNNCSVELEIDDIKIVRTRRPNRLIVNDKYLDIEGQTIINSKFGKTFSTTGYIAQNAYNSFIMMSPMDKLSFLEKFAFQNINLMEIKDRCKGITKKYNDNLISNQSKMEMCETMFEEIEKPVFMKFPIKCSKSNRDKIIKNERIKKSNNEIYIKKCEKYIIKLTQEKLDTSILSNALDLKNKNIRDINDTLEDINKKLEKKSEAKSKYDEISSLEEQLDFMVSNRELKTLKKQYEENLQNINNMKYNEILENKSKLKKIMDVLWKEYSKKELSVEIEEIENCIEDIKKIDRIKKEQKNYKVDVKMIDNLDKELREKTQKCEQLRDSISKTRLYMSSYKCPNCDVSVKMLNGKLCLHDDNFDISGEVDDIDKLESEYAKMNNRVKDIQIKLPTLHSNYKKYNEIEEQIRLYEEEYEEIPDLKDIKEDLDNLIRYKNSQKSLEEKKCDIEDKIKNKKYSSTINNFENDIKSMKKTINYIEKSLKNCNCNYEEEEELREVINEVKNLDKEILELSNSSDKFTKLKEEHVKTIETWITKHKNDYDNNVRSVSDIEKEIKEEKSKINNFKEIIEICVSNLEKIDKYLENKKEINRYNEWSRKVTESRKKEKKSRKDLSCIMKLKEKILEAESIAMINVINSINQHAQIYLDDFFPVEPISVRLLPFKESKKSNKPQINVQIEYKGQDCGIDSLSGGELSRVVLAFTLALGEMFNVPLVMLDECTASLDQEMTTIVVESIKEHFTDKLVIIVAHQVIEGAFDSVLTIK